MFVFSDVQDCDYDPKAKEILVFSDELEKNSYNPIPQDSSQHNTCLYKLRAIEGADGKWGMLIRKGRQTTNMLHVDPIESYSSYQEALEAAAQYLLSSIISNTLSVFPKLSKNTTVEEKFWGIVNYLTFKGISSSLYFELRDDGNLYLKLNVYRYEEPMKEIMIIALTSNKTKIQLICDTIGSDIVTKMYAWQTIDNLSDVIDIINDLPGGKLSLSALRLRN